MWRGIFSIVSESVASAGVGLVGFVSFFSLGHWPPCDEHLFDGGVSA
jgi:hypothetical protein